MNGFIRTAAASLCLGAGALTVTGCTQYRAHVDPCWPERYDSEGRRNIKDTFDAQASNGHVLDQTIWNNDFELDEKGNPTDKLTVGGQERLKYLMRRRPMPDGRVYLQTANDLPKGIEVDRLAEKRQELDTQRVASVQKYLGAVMAGRVTPVNWDVAVHDPAPVGMAANLAGGAPAGFSNRVTGAYPQLANNFQGVLGTVNGFTLMPGGGGGGGTGGAATGAPQGQQGAGSPQSGAGTPPPQNP